MSDQLTAPTDVVLVDGCACRCHDGPGVPCSELGGCGSIHARPAAPAIQVDTEDEDGPPQIDRSRRCARDRRCPDKQRVVDDAGEPVKVAGKNGKKHVVYVGTPINVDRGLCTICAQTVRNEIPHLAADWRELASLIAAGGDSAGEIVSSSRELPVPIRLSVEALMRSIDNEVTVWAEHVADALGQQWDCEAAWASRANIRVRNAVAVLTDTTDTLIGLPSVDRETWNAGEAVWTWCTDPDEPKQPGWWERDYHEQDGLDAALRMLDLHERTRVLAGRGELVHRLPAPCPNPRCGRQSLVRPNGKDHVECETCHERWPEADYVRLTLVLSDAENRRIKACDRCDTMGRLPTRRREMCDHKPRKQAVAA